VHWKDEIREKGHASKEWVEQQGHTEFSKLPEWLEKLIPDKHKPSNPRGMVTIADWMTYTNTHVLLANAGTKVKSNLNINHFHLLKSSNLLLCIFSKV
jgi:hypothetical protein